ncbi:DUF58 domain-containing protein [Paenibacillus sp. Marseille-Q4541]|uniref:DUF58 domain-containing protein n=1 Tax=Paenibacillus sp. Marseille-Q4541 TaxID=2831522 RepID=UPI001BA70DC2|nr:DUF58 domain-containing protein [Paenibacillus sp. Marseille-Q4541]
MWRTFISPLVMLLITSLLFFVYQLQGGETLLFLIVCCIILTGYGIFAQIVGPSRIHISRDFQPNRVTAGEKAEVRIQVTVESKIPLLWLKIEEAVPFKHTHIIFPRRRYYQSSYSYHLKAIHRGVYSFEHCKITWGDAFGWFTRSKQVEVPGEFIVHPSFHPHYTDSQEEYGKTQDGQRTRSSYLEEWKGYEVREYNTGDSLRSIHWKSSARRGKLQVRIPEESQANRLYLILDNEAYSYMYKGKDGLDELSWEAYDTAISLCAVALKKAYNNGISPYIATYSTQAGRHTCHWAKTKESMNGSNEKLINQLDYLSRLEPEGKTERNAKENRSLAGSSVEMVWPTTSTHSFPVGSQVYVVTGCLNEQNVELAKELSRQGLRVHFYEMTDWKKKHKSQKVKEHFLAAELEKERIWVQAVPSILESV